MDDRRGFLQRAKSSYRSAQAAPGEPSRPEDAARRPEVNQAHEQFILGESALQVALSTGDLGRFDEAISRYGAGLLLGPPAFMANLLLGATSDAFRQRYEFSGEEADLDSALELIEVLKPHLDPLNPLDREVILGVAAALVDAFYASGRRSDQLDEVIRLCHELVDHGASDPAPWRYYNTLAGGYLALYERDGRVDAQEKAYAALRHSYQCVPRGHRDRPTVVANLAEAALTLHDLVQDQELLELPRRELLDALENEEMDPVYLRPRLQLRLATLLLARRSPTAEWGTDLRIARRAAKDALGSAERTGLERERTRVAYANVLIEYYKLGHGVSDLRRACDQHRLAVAEESPDSPNRIPYQAALASALRLLAIETANPIDTESAVAAYRAIWASETPPTGHLDQIRAATEWGLWAMNRSAWEEAIEALTKASSALRDAYPAQLTRSHKEVWLAAARDVPVLLGYAYSRVGTATDAALALEAGRAVLLAEVAARRAAHGMATQKELGLVQAVQAALRPSESTLAEASRWTPLCYVAATPYGGVAVLVVAEVEIHVVNIPEMTTESAATQARLLHAALQLIASEPEESERGLASCAEWCWSHGMGAIHDVLVGRSLQQVALIPHGELTQLPLHAAETHGRCFIDYFAVTYAPSARSLVESGKVASSLNGRESFLFVQEPQPVQGRPLRYADAEVNTLREIASSTGAEAIVLAGREATKAAFMRELANASAAHFSGHALADPTNPENSRLELAPNDPVTVAELRGESLAATRIVTLSACESAVVGQQLPDEAIGLPGALLEAGAAGVVATMWPIRDSPTIAYLLGAFYDHWAVEQLPPHLALAEATRWLRKARRQELLGRFPQVEPHGQNAEVRRLMGDRRVAIADWASFILVGI